MKSGFRTFVICILAVILNFFTAFVCCSKLHFPLFLDTIFTVAVLFYCGLFPAVLVQVSYNIINSLVWTYNTGFFDVCILMYTVCGMLIVFSSWIIARRKEEFEISLSVTLLYLLLIAMISSACSVIAGGVIDYFHLMYYDIPDKVNPIKKFTEGFVRQEYGLFVSCIVAQIPVSFADRIVSTFAGYGVFNIMNCTLGRNL